jgi:hypothetical protein
MIHTRDELFAALLLLGFTVTPLNHNSNTPSLQWPEKRAVGQVQLIIYRTGPEDVQVFIRDYRPLFLHEGSQKSVLQSRRYHPPYQDLYKLIIIYMENPYGNT